MTATTDRQTTASRVVRAGTGSALRVRAGDEFRVVDPLGAQVGDLFVFVDTGAARLTTHLSAGHTRVHTNRLFPAVGEDFLSDARMPVVRLVDDTSPGRHDMLIPACDPQRYRQLGAADHRSCVANLHEALAALNLRTDVIPQPVNLNMDIPVADTGGLRWLSAPSRAGDAVTFRAHVDVVVALSACPQDLVTINGSEPTDLVIDVLANA